MFITWRWPNKVLQVCRGFGVVHWLKAESRYAAAFSFVFRPLCFGGAHSFAGAEAADTFASHGRGGKGCARLRQCLGNFTDRMVRGWCHSRLKASQVFLALVL